MYGDVLERKLGRMKSKNGVGRKTECELPWILVSSYGEVLRFFLGNWIVSLGARSVCTTCIFDLKLKNVITIVIVIPLSN